jgi:hypothetical protein
LLDDTNGISRQGVQIKLTLLSSITRTTKAQTMAFVPHLAAGLSPSSIPPTRCHSNTQINHVIRSKPRYSIKPCHLFMQQGPNSPKNEKKDVDRATMNLQKTLIFLGYLAWPFVAINEIHLFQSGCNIKVG